MSIEEAVDLIKEWFDENFEDPSQHTPRDDGEFVYIWEVLTTLATLLAMYSRTPRLKK